MIDFYITLTRRLEMKFHASKSSNWVLICDNQGLYKSITLVRETCDFGPKLLKKSSIRLRDKSKQMEIEIRLCYPALISQKDQKEFWRSANAVRNMRVGEAGRGPKGRTLKSPQPVFCNLYTIMYTIKITCLINMLLG